MVRNFKRSLTVLVILILVGATYAFAAANSVPDTNAGYGSTIVSGYTVTDVLYNAPTGPLVPDKVKTITFTLTPDGLNLKQPAFVYINTVSGAPVWISCTTAATTPVGGWNATCSFTVAIDVEDITTLDIVASNSPNP